MKVLKKIYADFNNADEKGRIRLNTSGSLSDIKKDSIKLEEDLEVQLDDDDGLTALGIIQFSEDEKIWVAKINWDELNK